jgi:CheY-like chemotaxis protein
MVRSCCGGLVQEARPEGAAFMAQHGSFRVLLVDDDISLLESMAAVLSDQFVVRAAGSALQALRTMERESFHVVCTDWQMPGMDGLEFFREVAQRNLAPKPCFILVTAHASGLLDRIPYDDRKMLGMLGKPFSPQQLIDRVNQFAGLAHLKRSSAALNEVLGERK